MPAPAALNASADPLIAGLAPIPIALLVDVGSGQTLFARRERQQFLPASVTKTMTAYLAFELIDQGKLRLDQKFAVTPEIYRNWHGQGTSMNLSPGEWVTVSDLLHGLMTVSANDAAMVLATGYAGSVQTWCALMNAEARKLGMADSAFGTPNGWPDEGVTRVSARDLVKLGQAMIARHPDLYREFIGNKRMTWNGMAAVNHDPLLGKVPGADGIKTGFFREAGYNYLGTVRRDGRRLMMVIGGAPSGPDRALAARTLVEWGFASWQSRPLFPAGKLVGTAKVQGGAAREVGLVAPFPVEALVPAGAANRPVRLTIRYNGPLRAPIAKGASVASLEISTVGMPPARIGLIAAQGIAVAGPIDRLRNGLLGLIP